MADNPQKLMLGGSEPGLDAGLVMVDPMLRGASELFLPQLSHLQVPCWMRGRCAKAFAGGDAIMPEIAAVM